MTVPDFMPILLSRGAHEGPESGACLMEAISFLTGEEWSDRPKCVDEELAYVGQNINDNMDPEHRQLLLNYVNRFIGTAHQPVTLSHAIVDLDTTDDDPIVVAWLKIQNLNTAYWDIVKAWFGSGDSDKTEYQEAVYELSGRYLVALDNLLSALEEANAAYATPIQPDQLARVNELLV